MKKTVQVIIKQKNSRLGPIHTIQSVALGYAINYLIPNKIVEIASKGRIKHVKMLKNIQSKQADFIYSKHIKIKQNLEQLNKITIRKKIGENQQIFGRITENEIIEKIFKLTGEKINKKQVRIPNIKEIGIYSVIIKIEDNINANIKIQVLPNVL